MVAEWMMNRLDSGTNVVIFIFARMMKYQSNAPSLQALDISTCPVWTPALLLNWAVIKTLLGRFPLIWNSTTTSVVHSTVIRNCIDSGSAKETALAIPLRVTGSATLSRRKTIQIVESLPCGSLILKDVQGLNNNWIIGRVVAINMTEFLKILHLARSTRNRGNNGTSINSGVLWGNLMDVRISKKIKMYTWKIDRLYID